MGYSCSGEFTFIAGVSVNAIVHMHAHTHIHTHTRPAVSRDGTARLWDCGSARCLAKVASIQHPIYSCSISASELVAKRNSVEPLGVCAATSWCMLTGMLQCCTQAILRSECMNSCRPY